MTLRLFFLGLVLVYTGLLSVAQAEEALTFPVFADLLTLERELPSFNNTTRQIYQDGVATPYPPTVHEFQSMQAQGTGNTWLLAESTNANTINFWEWDGESASLRALEVCGTELEDSKILWGEGTRETRIFIDEGEHHALCSLPSGEQITLPPEIRLSYGVATLPSVSPDGRYLVNIDLRDPEPNEAGLGRYHIYSFDTETQTLIFLGTIPFTGELGGYLNPSFWVEDRYLLLRQRRMQEWATGEEYVIDVTRPNSLRFALMTWRYGAEYVANPPSLEYMISVLSDGPTSGPCYLEIYDIQSDTFTRYDTGSLCDYGLIVPNGTGERIYRAYYPQAGIVRFNPFTGEQHTIYTGEVEGLYRLSPTGRYALIGLDANGIVSNPQDVYEVEMPFEPQAYAVLDLTNGAILGNVPLDGGWTGEATYYVASAEQSTLYHIETDRISTLALAAQVLATTVSGDIYLFDPQAEQIRVLNLETQRDQLLVTELAGWQPRLLPTATGFQLEIRHANGPRRGYELRWR